MFETSLHQVEKTVIRHGTNAGDRAVVDGGALLDD
jgi:hypothetical protein